MSQTFHEQSLCSPEWEHGQRLEEFAAQTQQSSAGRLAHLLVALMTQRLLETQE